MSQQHFGRYAGAKPPNLAVRQIRDRESRPSHLEPSRYEDYGRRSATGSDLTPNVSDGERALSLAAGIGIGLFGAVHGRLKGLALTAIGAALAWRGYTGHCHAYHVLGIDTAERPGRTAVPAQQGCKLEKTLIINRSPADLYQFWRRLENLPQVLRHLKLVERQDNRRSHWVAVAALGKEVQWDAEIINDRENEMIAWRSLPGGDIETAGSIHFEPLGNNRATEVTVAMKYNPPAGKIGAQLASLLGDGLEEMLDDDLKTFKQVMETGMPAAPSTS